jgi:ubiquinone/menaquinone biosynthesis C-methylase UbiE
MNPQEYETMYRVEDRHWWYEGLRKMIGSALSDYGPPDGSRFLDIGCGTGANMAMLSGRYDMAGIDISGQALALCRARSIQPLARGSANAIPLAAEQFDAALMMDLLYHAAVSDKAEALREAKRVLKPGGLLLINVPAYDWLRSSHDRAIHTDTRFTRGEINCLLEAAGFKTERATYWDTLLFPAAVAARLWGKLRPREGSDLESPPGKLANTFLQAILRAERLALRHTDLPFGLSIFAVARKPLGGE